MELKNKVVVITGGSKGLGKALATLFVKEGAKTIISSLDNIELEKTAIEIGAVAISVDVTKENEIQDLSEKVVKDFGRIDFWINDAGIWLPHELIEEMDLKRVHDMIEVNLFGVIFGSKYALIQMKKQNSGTILTILSTSALDGRAGSSGYCASKYAATGFTKSLRKEVKDNNIKTINIYPGGMQTHFFDEAKPEKYIEFMEPSYVANLIIENLEKENPEEELIIKRP